MSHESLRELSSMERNRASCEKLYKGALIQAKIIENADARSVLTTSSQMSRTRAKLEAIQTKVKLAEEEAALGKGMSTIRQKQTKNTNMQISNYYKLKR